MNNIKSDLRRIAILSVHSSPLHQPGTGDSGGMNVYIAETAKVLARHNIEIEIFTRATSIDEADITELAPGVTVRHIQAGPFEGLLKEDLPAQLCAVTAGVLRAEAAKNIGYYDLIHSHYWLSGQVGWIAQERWNVPLVHTMHTMARVKNLQMSNDDRPEPAIREIGEEQVVHAADRLVANTEAEATELVELYDAVPDKVRVVHPGVDLELFSPGDRQASRASLGIPKDAVLLLFVGRIQPLKAPDVLLKAASELLKMQPELRSKLVVAICGGPSGTGLENSNSLVDLAVELGIRDCAQFIPPLGRDELVHWFRSANITVVPSYSESFGLVALESQACGTPVIAAHVGGLPTAVASEARDYLVRGHEPVDWANMIAKVLADSILADRLGKAGLLHAAHFGWESTASALLEVYQEAVTERRRLH
mgnify:CR=1 FL=1